MIDLTTEDDVDERLRNAANESSKRSLDSPSGQTTKRLKQACLPFKVVPSPVNSPSSASATKLPLKRVCSESSDECLVKCPKEVPTSPTPSESTKENQTPPQKNSQKKFKVTEVSNKQSNNSKLSVKPKDDVVTVVELSDDSNVCSGDGKTGEEESKGTVHLTPSSSPLIDTVSQTIEDVVNSCCNSSTPNREDETNSEPEVGQNVSLDDDEVEVLNVSISSDKKQSSSKEGTPPGLPRKKVFKKRVKKNPTEAIEREKRIQEKLKARLETARLREELQRQRQEAKERREKEKAERDKEKQQKKEQEDKEKLEKQVLKEEEKKRKQDLLQAKLEEKRLKEEEKQQQEEEKRKKKDKVKAVFAKFFVKKDVIAIASQETRFGFRPFEVKANMRLAPVHRNCLHNSTELTKGLELSLKNQDDGASYLLWLRSGGYCARKCVKTWPAESELEIICESQSKKPCQFRGKLLQFTENTRPPYWGTWRKKSKIVSARRPFAQDKIHFDYEVDSDEEWEEEEPGESLSHSEDEKESEDDYEVDNEFFVPHGYLSEEEALDEDRAELSADALKEQLKQKERQFVKEISKKCLQIKPKVFGCVWIDEIGNDEELLASMGEYAAVLMSSTPIETSFSSSHCDTCLVPSCSSQADTGATVEPVPSASSTFKKPAKYLEGEDLKSFIRLVHGNIYGQAAIFVEFKAFWNANDNAKLDTTGCTSPGSGDVQVAARPAMSKGTLKRTLSKIASYGRFQEPGPLFNQRAWCVSKEVREELCLTDLLIPNQWKYQTEPKKCTNQTKGQEKSGKIVPSKFFNCKPKPTVAEPVDLADSSNANPPFSTTSKVDDVIVID